LLRKAPTNTLLTYHVVAQHTTTSATACSFLQKFIRKVITQAASIRKLCVNVL